MVLVSLVVFNQEQLINFDFMKKQNIKLLLLTIIIFLLIYFRTSVFSFVSIPISWFMPVDNNYIINQKEWISDNGNLIRFDDYSSKIKSDTIFVANKATYIIKSLNKHFNQINVHKIDNKEMLVFTSTIECER